MEILLLILDLVVAVVLVRDLKSALTIWQPIPFLPDFEISIWKRDRAILMFTINILILGGSALLAIAGHMISGYSLFVVITVARLIKLLRDRRRMRE